MSDQVDLPRYLSDITFDILRKHLKELVALELEVLCLFFVASYCFYIFTGQ